MEALKILLDVWADVYFQMQTNPDEPAYSRIYDSLWSSVDDYGDDTILSSIAEVEDGVNAAIERARRVGQRARGIV